MEGTTIRTQAAIVVLMITEDGHGSLDSVSAVFARFDPQGKRSLDSFITAAGGHTLERDETHVILKFPDAVAATSCVVGLRARLLKPLRKSQRDEVGAALRIGIDFGEVTIGSDDLHAYRANIASELARLAGPQQMGLSKAAYVNATAQHQLALQGQKMLRVDGVEPVETYLVAIDGDQTDTVSATDIVMPSPPPRRRSLWRPLLATVALLMALGAASAALEVPYDRERLASVAADVTEKIPGKDVLLSWGEKLNLLDAAPAPSTSGLDQTPQRDYRFATAPTGTPLAKQGTILAEQIGARLDEGGAIDLEVVPSDSQKDSLKRLRAGDIHFAILEGLVGHFGYSGSGPNRLTGADPDLRAVATIWPRAEQFVIRKEFLKTGTIDDLFALKGEKVSLGAPNSSNMHSSGLLLRRLEAQSSDDVDVVFLSQERGVEALVSGEIAGMSLPGLVPSDVVAELFQTLGSEITILQFNDEHLAKANERLGLWANFLIPANTYQGQTEAIQTIAQAHFIATRAETNNDVVYGISKAILENVTFLDGLGETVRPLRLETALIGLPVPLHPGALTYYTETPGLEISLHLMPPDIAPTQ